MIYFYYGDQSDNASDKSESAEIKMYNVWRDRRCDFTLHVTKKFYIQLCRDSSFAKF
jgi:hypothetical protein